MIYHCSIWGKQRCRGREIATVTPILLSFPYLLSLQCNCHSFHKRRQVYFHTPWRQVWLCDLFWPTAWGKSARVSVWSMGPRDFACFCCSLAPLPLPREHMWASTLVPRRGWETCGAELSSATPSLGQPTPSWLPDWWVIKNDYFKALNLETVC